MNVDSHELQQVVNMMFWEVDTDKKKKSLRIITSPKKRP